MFNFIKRESRARENRCKWDQDTQEKKLALPIAGKIEEELQLSDEIRLREESKQSPKRPDKEHWPKLKQQQQEQEECFKPSGAKS